MNARKLTTGRGGFFAARDVASADLASPEGGS
jgi:hypothetical protein